MEHRYQIESYSINSDGDTMMVFKNNSGQQTTVNLQKYFPGYCPIPQNYYTDENGELVKMGLSNRVIYIDGEHTYKRATQFDLDKYEAKFPDSDNGKIFNHLQKVWNN